MFLVKSRLHWIFWALCIVLSPGAPAAQTQPTAPSDPVLLNPDHPAVHTVEEGDTLWDISAQFLKEPWQWPTLWRWNPEIDDPDLIFPGDQIRLIQDAAGPRLVIDRTNSPNGSYETERRSPRVRTQPLPPPISLVSSDRIKPFIVDHTIVSPASLATAGIVIAGDDERLLSGTGDRVFVSDWLPPPGSDRSTASVALVRPGTVYRHPKTGEELGQELTLLAWGRVVQLEKKIAVVELQEVSVEVRSGDQVMSLGRTTMDPTTHPRPPSTTLRGEILAVNGGMGHVGALDVVVLTVGSREGATAGDTLAVFRQGAELKHPVSGDLIAPPPDRSGLVLLFRVFDRLSYGLIVESERPLRVGDLIGNP